MSLSRVLSISLSLALVGLLSACTIEPLNASRSDSQLARGGFDASTAQILASTEVTAVDSRVAQQVRNSLLFAMNGGVQQPNGRYRVTLSVKDVTQTLSVQALLTSLTLTYL